MEENRPDKRPEAPAPTGLETLPRRTARVPAHREIAGRIRNGILSGRLPGGTPLVQAELANEFGTSNTPIREAIQELAGEGLVRLDPYRQAVVHAPSIGEIRESYEIAILLEPVLAGKAAARVRGPLLEMRSLIGRMEEVESPLRYAELNRDLHQAIDELSGARQMTDLLTRLHDQSTMQTALCLGRGLRTFAASNDEHTAIVEALEGGRRAETESLMRAHLQATYDSLQAVAIDAPARD